MLCLWCDEQVVFSEVVFVDFKELSDNWEAAVQIHSPSEAAWLAYQTYKLQKFYTQKNMYMYG